MARFSPLVLTTAVCLVGNAFAGGSLCADACRALATRLPKRVSFPDTTAYNESISSYFSGQEKDLHPGCIYSPESTSEVVQFIKLVNELGHTKKPGSPDIQFAIRSGGHTVFSGAANINGGITVDMRAINSMVLSEDRKVASIGTGAKWSELYPELLKYNITVMGGRVTDIGVGGLITGGGINFFSRRYGFDCDNVYGYEVVLASGEVVYATAGSYSDLWLALKGGSNNFGIVTRVDLPTFEVGTVWGGIVHFNYTQEVIEAEAAAFANFMSPEAFDDAADMAMAFIFRSPTTYLAGNPIYYVKPAANPPIYQPFTSIPENTYNTLRYTNISDLVFEQAGGLPANQSRSISITTSYYNDDVSLIVGLVQIWDAATRSLSDVEGLQLTMLNQPYPVTNGTNSLGFPVGATDVILLSVTSIYKNSADDDRMQSAIQAIVDKHKALLQSRGVLIPYQYLNYADKSQDPIASYGAAVKARLQRVSKKYDPHSMFQKQVPGGFKLFP
ncbi:FAD-binding domain-containing protein [Thozetella sp. PMI_491]|nr:FAD-binding domain-containing protein [Thozetella sp. PMI_491]